MRRHPLNRFALQQGSLSLVLRRQDGHAFTQAVVGRIRDDREPLEVEDLHVGNPMELATVAKHVSLLGILLDEFLLGSFVETRVRDTALDAHRVDAQKRFIEIELA